jgi:hypothetical protein
MDNILLGYPNRADECSLSGGSWTKEAPLSMLLTRVYSETAVSTDASPASSQFDAACISQRPIRIVAMAGHNLTGLARWRVRASNTPGSFSTPLYDSGAVAVYPPAPFGQYDWSDASFWSGTISAETRAYYPSVALIVLPAPVLAQYWRIELIDPGNPAGCIALGRLFLCPAWQPAYNVDYGLQWGHETTTTVEETHGGIPFFDEQPLARTLQFSLGWLSQAEVFGPGFDLVRRQGLTREVFLVFDPGDSVYCVQRSFPARLKALPSFVVASKAAHSATFQLKELI